VQRLLEEEGIYYFFKHEEAKHTLVLADSITGHETVAGYESILYTPEGAQGLPAPKSISGT
jgi:type VI secretion system secreted protein VgrG